MFTRSESSFPMLRYPWVDVRAALQTLARTQPEIEAVQVAYINPETGADAQKILGFSALMLRPGETLQMPARSSATVFHVIEGGAAVVAEASRFALGEADTCCLPGYTAIKLVNASATEATFIFMADDAPLQKKLGVYEVRNAEN
jgi:gentisate 1,2-dioxygenase